MGDAEKLPSVQSDSETVGQCRHAPPYSGSSRDSGGHADILFSVQSTSGHRGRQGMQTYFFQFSHLWETVRAIQTCSSQFSQLLDTAGEMQAFSSQFSHHLEAVRDMQICSSRFSQLLRQFGHAEMLLSVQSPSGYSGAQADMLLSGQSASKTVMAMKTCSS